MNNLEQGVIIACALASTGSIFFIALAVCSASLRTIDIAHQLRRIADAMEAGNRKLNPPSDPITDDLIDAVVDVTSNSKPVRLAEPGDFTISGARLNRLGRITTVLNKQGRVKP